MSNRKPEPLKLGFYTTVSVPERGYVGGFLVTNHLGRPLEFQCTAPLKPNRTQELLYGNTLRPYLLGEVIGRTLVEKVSVKPELLLVDDAELMELRNHVSMAVAVVKESASGSHLSAQVGRRTLTISADAEEDKALLDRAAKLLPEDADLLEPFARVKDALKEALGMNSQAEPAAA